MVIEREFYESNPNGTEEELYLYAYRKYRGRRKVNGKWFAHNGDELLNGEQEFQYWKQKRIENDEFDKHRRE